MSKKRMIRLLMTLSLAAVMVVTSVSMSFACTSMYFGKDTTENGSTFIGRSEDSSWTTYRKFYTVREAADHQDGEMYVSNATDFTIEYPAHTYRYTMVKDVSNYAPDPTTMEEMAQAGTNEKGVAVTGTVTLSGGHANIVGNRKQGITGIDEHPSEGITEEDIPSVVLMSASTAREGAQLLIDIVEEHGAGGRDMTAIIDSKECWVVQTLSGHVAVASRLPSDMVGTTPNITFNIDLGDKKNTIATSNLVSTAEEAGTLVRDYTGKVKVADSYATKPNSVSGRLYNCYLYLRGEKYADAFKGGYIDYLHEPRTEKYSTFEILRSLAFRGEGGKNYAGATPGNLIGIGNDNNLETHMFESRDNMPKELAVVQWMGLGPTEFFCCLPGYNALITNTIEENSIGLDTMVFNNDQPELNNYRAWLFELYFLCKGRDNQDGLEVGSLEARTKYGKGVQEFWEAYQKELIKQQPVIDEQMKKILAYDKKLAEEKATALNMHLQKESLVYLKQMVGELKEFQKQPQEGGYTPSCMGNLPTYNFDAVGGTGLPPDQADIDQAAADEVVNLINALPAADKITAADKAKVEEAQAAYDKLTADQKKLVPADVLNKLKAAQDTLKNDSLKKPVKPGKVAIKKVKGGKKKATVTWKKVAKNTTGYQIQLKPKKGKAKIVTVKQGKKATMKKVVKKLKKGTYKVRVRAYNKADGKTLYGKWSKPKTVKIK